MDEIVLLIKTFAAKDSKDVLKETKTTRTLG